MVIAPLTSDPRHRGSLGHPTPGRTRSQEGAGACTGSPRTSPRRDRSCPGPRPPGRSHSPGADTRTGHTRGRRSSSHSDHPHQGHSHSRGGTGAGTDSPGNTSDNAEQLRCCLAHLAHISTGTEAVGILSVRVTRAAQGQTLALDAALIGRTGGVVSRSIGVTLNRL